MILLEVKALDANVITTIILGIVIGVLAYFIKRLISQQDTRHQEIEKQHKGICDLVEIRHKEMEKRVGDCDDRSDVIEKNYLRKFDEVNKEINRTRIEHSREIQEAITKLGEKLSNEIRAIIKDKQRADLIQVRELTEIKGEVKHLQDAFNKVQSAIDKATMLLKN